MHDTSEDTGPNHGFTIGFCEEQGNKPLEVPKRENRDAENENKQGKGETERCVR